MVARITGFTANFQAKRSSLSKAPSLNSTIGAGSEAVLAILSQIRVAAHTAVELPRLAADGKTLFRANSELLPADTKTASPAISGQFPAVTGTMPMVTIHSRPVVSRMPIMMVRLSGPIRRYRSHPGRKLPGG